MLKNLNEYHDPRYEKISFYVIRTALILVLAGAVMYWVFGKAGNILRLVLAVVNPLIVGIGLAYLFSPLVQKCENGILRNIKKPGLRRGLSVAMTLGAVVLFLLVLVGLLITTVTRSVTMIHPEQYIEYFKSLGEQMSQFAEMIENKLEEMSINVGTIGGYLSSILASVKDVASALLFSLIFAIYFLMDSGIKKYWGDILILFTKEKTREHLLELAKDADHVFAGYIRGQVIDAMLVGTLTAAALTLAGVPYGAVVGLLTGLGNLIPYIGPLVGFGSLIIVCLMGQSLLHLALGGVILAVVMFVDGNIINPRLLSANVEVHPVLVIVALLAGGQIGGVVGMLVSVPCAAFLKLQFDKYVEKKRREQEKADI